MDNLNEPKVSILITTYNSELYIDRAIESVINQTYTNWEIIIIDDNSTDNTIKLLKKHVSMNTNKIKIIYNNMNYGTYYSLNQGISISNGDFITKLDSDDVYHIDKLKNQIDFCIENLFEACTCNIVRGYYNGPKNIVYKNEASDSSLIFSRNVFNTIGYFDNARFDCDSEYYYRIKKYFIVPNLDQNLYYARYRINSLTSSYLTGTNIKQLGSEIRKQYKINYKKNHIKYLNHPKYIRNFNIHPIQKSPIDLEINGSNKIIEENQHFINLEFFENGEIINYYKIIPNKDIQFNNIYNYDFDIYDLSDILIKYECINEDLIKFISNTEYIKIISKFNKGIYKYYPLIIK